jgi:hypothetical protein
MAHFAELNENNIVVRVITFSNKEVDDNGGDQSVEAENFVAARHGGTWKQTSYNNNFRCRYAGQGFFYDAANDIFRPQQPFPSWTLSSDGKYEWLPPLAQPTDEQCNYTYNSEPYLYISLRWDETTQKWRSLHGDDTVYEWDGTAWSQVTPVINKEDY